MLKNKFLILIALLCLVGFASCNDDVSGGGPPEPPVDDTTWIQEVYPLAGTKWQVSKVIHTETGKERPIFVGDELFTEFVPIMDFETDTTGILYSYYDEVLPALITLGSDFDWFRKYTQEGLPCVASLIVSLYGKERWRPDYNRYYGYKSYKLEGTQLKFYFHDDGFFYFNPDGSIRHMCHHYSTDSNWYNCIVLEEVK